MSLRSFLGLAPTQASPEHSTLTLIRQRLPKELIEQVFAFVLKLAFEKKQLKGRAIGIDAATLEAKVVVRIRRGPEWPSNACS